MGLSHDKDKWKTKGKSNARIGISSVVSVKTLGSEDKDGLLGNSNLNAGHASQPKQGRRM